MAERCARRPQDADQQDGSERSGGTGSEAQVPIRSSFAFRIGSTMVRPLAKDGSYPQCYNPRFEAIGYRPPPARLRPIGFIWHSPDGRRFHPNLARFGVFDNPDEPPPFVDRRRFSPGDMESHVGAAIRGCNSLAWRRPAVADGPKGREAVTSRRRTKPPKPH
jgi:hypothetical protein